MTVLKSSSTGTFFTYSTLLTNQPAYKEEYKQKSYKENHKHFLTIMIVFFQNETVNNIK